MDFCSNLCITNQAAPTRRNYYLRVDLRPKNNHFRIPKVCWEIKRVRLVKRRKVNTDDYNIMHYLFLLPYNS